MKRKCTSKLRHKLRSVKVQVKPE